MSDNSPLQKNTPDIVIKWVMDVEGVCGLDCMALRQLDDNASPDEIKKAYQSDHGVFQSVAHDLNMLTQDAYCYSQYITEKES